jgi:hypothetical protein
MHHASPRRRPRNGQSYPVEMVSFAQTPVGRRSHAGEIGPGREAPRPISNLPKRNPWVSAARAPKHVGRRGRLCIHHLTNDGTHPWQRTGALPARGTSLSPWSSLTPSMRVGKFTRTRARNAGQPNRELSHVRPPTRHRAGRPALHLCRGKANFGAGALDERFHETCRFVRASKTRGVIPANERVKKSSRACSL